MHLHAKNEKGISHLRCFSTVKLPWILDDSYCEPIDEFHQWNETKSHAQAKNSPDLRNEIHHCCPGLPNKFKGSVGLKEKCNHGNVIVKGIIFFLFSKRKYHFAKFPCGSVSPYVGIKLVLDLINLANIPVIPLHYLVDHALWSVSC